jgi:hypothetical protein
MELKVISNILKTWIQVLKRERYFLLLILKELYHFKKIQKQGIPDWWHAYNDVNYSETRAQNQSRKLLDAFNDFSYSALPIIKTPLMTKYPYPYFIAAIG